MTVGMSGTGGGFQKFCRGETDISDASRPIRSTEMTACGEAGIDFIELPIAYDGIAIVVNPHAAWIDRHHGSRTEDAVGAGGQGKVRRWNQVRSRMA